MKFRLNPLASNGLSYVDNTQIFVGGSTQTSSSGGLADPGSNGILARTALNTTTSRTLTGTANQITITNGDGVAANPIFTLPNAIIAPGSLATTGHLTPVADSTYTLGASSFYWSNTYTDRIYLNATAYLDGTTAGRTTVSGEISAPDSVATGTERFGAGATASGQNSTAFGSLATATTTNSIVIGRSASDDGQSGAVVIGFAAGSTGANSFSLGRSTTAAAQSIAIGYQASAGFSTSIALGRTATTTANNQFVAGATTYYISNVFFGNGVTATAPQAYTINGTGGSGTNINGGDITIAGGKNTGSGTGGSILFQTAPAGASSSTLATLATRITIAHTTQTYVDAYDIAFGTTTGTKIGTSNTQKLGFWNATPVIQNTGWSATNVTSDKIFDADATSLNELADVVGTLIDTLKTYGILGA